MSEGGLGDCMDKVRLAHAVEPHLDKAKIVLAGVTSAIQAETKSDGAIPPVAYFGALLHALENQEGTEYLGAMVYLLNYVMPFVSQEVLRSRFERIADTFLEVFKFLLRNDLNNDHAELSEADRQEVQSQLAYIARNIVGCTATLLRTLTTQASWQGKEQPTQLLKALLMYTSAPNPKARKAAQKAATDVFHAVCGTKPIPKHPISLLVEFGKEQVAAASNDDPKPLLYLCNLLQQTLSFLPPTVCGQLLEPVLEQVSGPKPNPIVMEQVMRCLAVIFESDSRFQDTSDAKEQKEAKAHTELSDRIVEWLKALNPNHNDVQTCVSWLGALASGYAKLARADPLRASKSVAPVFIKVREMLLSPKPEVVAAAAETLASFVRSCFTPSLVQSAVLDSKAADRASQTPIEIMISALEELLSLRFHRQWPTVLKAIQVVFRLLPLSTFELPALQKLLKSLDSLHHTNELDDESQQELDNALGVAIESFGPERVLSLMPLDIVPDLDAPQGINEQLLQARTWLLSILKRYVKCSHLAFFSKVMMPLLDGLVRAEQHALEKKDPVVKVVRILLDRIWDAFTSFCILPQDIATFKVLAPKLAECMVNAPFTRPHIARGLFNLITAHQQILKGEVKVITVMDPLPRRSDDDEELTASPSAFVPPLPSVLVVPTHIKPLISADKSKEALEIIAGFSKGFLPVLFNMAEQAADNKREPFLEAISAYASITDTAAVNKRLKEVLKKLLQVSTTVPENPEDAEKRAHAVHTLTDLLQALCPYVTSDALGLLYKAIAQQLKDPDGTIQKKSYRILATLCKRHKSFFRDNWEAVITDLAEVSGSYAESAAKTRIPCLKAVMLQCAEHNLFGQAKVDEHIPEFIAECVLSLKATNSQAKQEGYDALTEFGRVLLDKDVANQSGFGAGQPTHVAYPLFTKFIVMVLAGLSGESSRMQSGSVLALARLVYAFRSVMPAEVLFNILEVVLPLFHSNEPAVRKAATSFVKVSCLALPAETLTPHLNSIIKAVTSQGRSSKKLRIKISGIFEILINRVGYETIAPLVPDNYKALLDHVKQQLKQREKKKQKAKEEKQKQGGAATGKGGRIKQARKVLEGSDDESEESSDEDEEMPAAKGKGTQKRRTLSSLKSSKKGAAAKAKASKKGTKKGDKTLLLPEGEGVDFTSPDAARQLLDAQPKKQTKKGKSLGKGIYESADGKLVIDDGSMDQKKKRKGGGDGVVAMDEGEDEATETKTAAKKGVKRKRDEESDEEQEEEREERGGKRAKGSKGKSVKAAKSTKGKSKKGTRGGKGDSKKKGQKYDPVSFHRIDASILNKRKSKSSKAAGQFEAIIKGAVKGAAAAKVSKKSTKKSTKKGKPGGGGKNKSHKGKR